MSFMQRPLQAILTGLLLLGATACYAEKFQAQDGIIDAARLLLEGEVQAVHGRPGEVSMGRLDPRLRLAACGGNLEAFLPPGARLLGNTTVGVRCNLDGGWTVYVTGRVALYGKVLVTAQPLARGDLITEDNVRLVERDLASLPRGYFDSPEPILGQLAKRHVGMNTVLNPMMVEPPTLVKRGERVTLVTGKPGFMIRSSGKAMGDGSAGELIRIKSSGSNRVVEGRVISAGVVKVTL